MPKQNSDSNAGGDADFKNSLSSLLAKGNPLAAPGGIRRATTLAKKEEEPVEPKQQIKFDIFNE